MEFSLKTFLFLSKYGISFVLKKVANDVEFMEFP